MPDAQFAGTIGVGAVSQNNVRLTTGTTDISSATTINSLALTGGNTSGSSALTVTSGAVLNSAASSVGNLCFNREAVFSVIIGNLTVNGTITGTSDGITKLGTGVLLL